MRGYNFDWLTLQEDGSQGVVCNKLIENFPIYGISVSLQ